MEKIPVVILGGFSTRKDKILSKKQMFWENYGVHYLEGEPKAIAVSDDNGRCLGQLVIDIINNSELTAEKNFFLGPKELYEPRLEGVEIINKNGSLFGNILISIHTLRSTGNKYGAIITSDLPLLTQEIFDNYMRRALQEMKGEKKLDIVAQAIDKDAALAGYENDYDKPSYPFISETGEVKNFIVGHLFIGRIDQSDMRFYDSFLKLASIMYGQRGMKRSFMLPMGILKTVFNVNLFGIGPLYRGWKSFKEKKLSLSDGNSILERLCVPRRRYKGSGSHFRILEISDAGFGLDLDTVEELDRLNLNYSDIARSEQLEWEQFWDKYHDISPKREERRTAPRLYTRSML